MAKMAKIAKCAGPLATVLLLSACGSNQSEVKSAANGPSSDSESSAPGATTSPAKTADPVPTKAVASGATPVASEKPYRLTFFELDRPPFAYTLKTPVNVQATPAPTLKKVSEKKNKVTDTIEWFEKNGLRLAGRMPQKDPALPKPPNSDLATLGSDKLHYVLDHGDHSILLYGAHYSATTTLLWLDNEKIARGQFSFSSWVKPAEAVAGKDELTDAEVGSSDRRYFVCVHDASYVCQKFQREKRVCLGNWRQRWQIALAKRIARV
jgi:hypothetical protein